MQNCWQNLAYVWAFSSRCSVPQKISHLSGVACISLRVRYKAVGSLNMMILDSRGVRLGKDLGGHLVQLAHFTGENSEALRGDTVRFGQSLH